MKRSFLENLRWYGTVAGLAAVLVLLAILQYQSTTAVGRATTEQMRAGLEQSLMNVREGLARELTPLCRELQAHSGTPTESALPDYAARFERWRQAAAHSDLVANIYIWQQNDGSDSQLAQFNPSRAAFEPVSWPDGLSKVHHELLESSGGPSPAGEPPREPNPNGPLDSHNPFPHPPPFGAPYDRKPPPDDGQEFERKAEHPPDRGPEPFGGDPYHPRPQSGGRVPPPPREGGNSSSWMIDQNVPALIHAFREPPRGGAPQAKSPERDWVVVVLDRRVLFEHIIPDLVQRHFGGNQSSYDIAVTGNRQESDLYSSRPGFDHQSGFVPDATLNLFGRPVPVLAGTASLLHGMLPPATLRRTPAIADQTSTNHSNLPRQEGMLQIEPIGYSAEDPGWEIVAKHREGSVEAAVAALTRRNLIFNFAVLLVLAATMGMIIATTLRGRRYAQMQMEFVANVSHELRTPLTGIISAAQNIADGLIDDKQRMARYGNAIVGEARQLSELVEQILLFSATEQDQHRYHPEPVDVAGLIDFSLRNTAALIRIAGATVDQQIQPDLPKVSVDFKAMAHCLQNLIANAVKYGGDGHWIGIRALATNGTSGIQEVSISVADKGIGITHEDLAHIFEPFYRTAGVTAAQIHGSGLGLPLAKKITESMGGRLTVESAPGKGSTFTIHLPTN